MSKKETEEEEIIGPYKNEQSINSIRIISGAWIDQVIDIYLEEECSEGEVDFYMSSILSYFIFESVEEFNENSGSYINNEQNIMLETDNTIDVKIETIDSIIRLSLNSPLKCVFAYKYLRARYIFLYCYWAKWAIMPKNCINEFAKGTIYFICNDSSIVVFLNNPTIQYYFNLFLVSTKSLK